ncbi:TetR/AcrR family transcriptional regulator [Arthrobacter sp. NPDC090010]|uniref:TetR/AcrR family transcriptional regulator n=1 Tax=Arthrobacter sp. NPDC090010 TaxID=3363942 RepID=UPI0038241F42
MPPERSPRTGGRAPQISREDIVRAGRDLGLHRLSVKAVATQLGVTPTALYRHVEGRWGLERAVGESLLAELELVDDPVQSLEDHLLSFAWQLRVFTLANPGLAGYLQILFPRGDSGHRLLSAEVQALIRRGYSPEAALVVSGAVASLSMALTCSEEQSMKAESADLRGLDRERQATLARLSRDTGWGEAHATLPAVPRPDYVRLLLTVSIRGLVEAAPPGRSVPDVISGLHSPSGTTAVTPPEKEPIDG